MYLWVAIDVNEQVSKLRENVEKYIRSNGLTSPTLTLPFHLSLKISFQIPNGIYREVVDDISEFCKSLKPFTIPVRKIEISGTILWLTMEDCSTLTYIHNELDALLLKKHGVAQHTFDKNFIFHTSVLIMKSEEEIQGAYADIKDTNIPNALKAEKIIIGSSEDGKAGTYSVNEEIML